jgi:hypothetical protein
MRFSHCISFLIISAYKDIHLLLFFFFNHSYDLKTTLGAGNVAQAVEHLCCKYEAPSSNPSTANNKKTQL